MPNREEIRQSFLMAQPMSETDFIHAIQELLNWRLTAKLREGPVLSNPATVKQFLCVHFLGMQHESFVVLFMDTCNQLVAAEELFQGTLCRMTVYPRELLKRALHWNAASVILAHNHPTGEAKPSDIDNWLTKQLKESLEHIEVKVLDHIIVAGTETMSFAEQGLL
jgi:DNA repair protein RadC